MIPTGMAARAVGRRVPQLNKMYRAATAKPMKGPCQSAKTAAFVHCITNLPQTVRMRHIVLTTLVVTMQIRDEQGNELQHEML